MLLKQDHGNELLYSNIEGESLLFSIGDPSIIIDIIRKKIYNHPIRTLVQEYLSNAKDACLEAGKKSDQIHVTLPTALNPEFIVRDFGVGMSEQRVKEVFVQYGISTKRDTNKQLGYFGIGAKSGWAYSDSFIVESFYNGVHREYIADIAQTKEGRLLLFKESETDEENGVLIKIPVESKDIHAFKIAYLRATFLWKHRPIIKDGLCYPELVFSYDDVKIYKGFGNRISDFQVVAGVYLNGNGIPFLVETINNKTIKDKFSDWCLNNGYAVCIKADPAKMSISANREGFANQKYGSTKAENAYNKLLEYAQNIFKSALLKDYLKTYNDYHWLISLVDKNLLAQSKPYNINKLNMYSREGQIQFELKRGGYLLRLITRTTFIKQIKTTICFSLAENKTNEIHVYLSRSKGLWTGAFPSNFKDIKATPDDLLDETKKALTYGRTLETGSEMHYVFFQATLTDQEYQEIAQIIGATGYIEDLYKTNLTAYKEERKKERLALKEQRDKEKEEKQKETEKGPVIKVTHFKRQHTRIRNCGRERSVVNLYDILPMYDFVFYGCTCEKYSYLMLKALPFKIAIVYANKKEIEEIKKLNDPKLRPTDDIVKCIKNDQAFLKANHEIAQIKKAKDFWEFFNKHNLISKKFDMENLKKESKRVLKHIKELESNGLSSHAGHNYDNYKGSCIFNDFMKTYPLLKKLSYLYDTNDIVNEINLYIGVKDGN